MEKQNNLLNNSLDFTSK